MKRSMILLSVSLCGRAVVPQIPPPAMPTPGTGARTAAVTAAPEQPKDEEHFLKISKALALRGLVHIRYQQFDDTSKIDGFDLRRARLEVKGDVAEHVGYRLQVDMAGVPRILDATFSYTVDDRLVLTFGQSKTPYCYDNFYNPWTTPTISRTQLDEALSGRERDLYGNQQGRDLGLRVSGKFATRSKRPIVEYMLGVYNGSGINRSDNNDDKDFGAALRYSPVKDLWLSGRYYTGIAVPGLLAETPGQHRERIGVDGSWTYKRYLVEGEYLMGSDADLDRSGYYGTLGCFIVKEKLQVLGRYDQYDPDASLSSDASVRYVAAVNWFFNTNTRILFEADFVDDEGTELDNNLYAIQFQAAF